MMRELTIAVCDDYVVVEGLVNCVLDRLALLILAILLVFAAIRTSADQKRVVEFRFLLF